MNIPPLVNSYMNLSPTMRMFGGGINHEFSEAEETCIMISFDEIYDAKRARHIDSFIKETVETVRRRFPRFAAIMGDDLAEMIAQKRVQVQERVQERRNIRRARKAQRKANRVARKK